MAGTVLADTANMTWVSSVWISAFTDVQRHDAVSADAGLALRGYSVPSGIPAAARSFPTRLQRLKATEASNCGFQGLRQRGRLRVPEIGDLHRTSWGWVW